MVDTSKYHEEIVIIGVDKTGKNKVEGGLGLV